ncbi:MAG: hypothetical protein KME26_28135 [Oscillatoria princeps RMCB-10]|nr:hypothetical protein [Oscillatoria princeps RMCB-10]
MPTTNTNTQPLYFTTGTVGGWIRRQQLNLPVFVNEPPGGTLNKYVGRNLSTGAFYLD